MTTSSFSYKQFFHGNSVMIIVPHEDDEINMAGATRRTRGTCSFSNKW